MRLNILGRVDSSIGIILALLAPRKDQFESINRLLLTTRGCFYRFLNLPFAVAVSISRRRSVVTLRSTRLFAVQGATTLVDMASQNQNAGREKSL